MPSKHWPVELVGAACSLGGKHVGCRYGPDVLLRNFLHANAPLPPWRAIIREPQSHLLDEKINAVKTFSKRLSDAVLTVCKQQHMPVVIGGDHSCAIGTWAGVSHTQSAPIGMLWIDAHLDSHTPETSHSGAIHGMPLACLLGHGDPRLLRLEARRPILDPAYTVVFGARSFETEERQLLKKEGVQIYTMEAIQKIGLNRALHDAVEQISRCPHGYGISIDLDAFDPAQVAGVSVPEPDGLCFHQLLPCLRLAAQNHKLLGLEIAEFNPSFDATGRTAYLIQHMIQQLCESDQFQVA